jgi:hypothetical protein
MQEHVMGCIESKLHLRLPQGSIPLTDDDRVALADRLLLAAAALQAGNLGAAGWNLRRAADVLRGDDQ